MEAEAHNTSDTLVSCILVLIQLNYPSEMSTAELVFNHIWSGRGFAFTQFTTYIICPDFLEEFMHIYTNDNAVMLQLNAPAASSVRRIGTRGVDRGIKDEFRQMIRKQMARSNEDIDTLIIRYITQERTILKTMLFGS